MQFSSQYNSRVIVYERKMFIRLADGADVITIFRVAWLCYAEIKHSDWLETVMVFGIANQNDLFSVVYQC